MQLPLKKVISGGQTGADRAGLEAAKALGLATGGTAPKGWRIQNPDGTDGSDPSLEQFGLVEHKSREYPPRTVRNVLDSDGTVWIGFEHSGGGRLTIATAKKHGKPIAINPSSDELRQWVLENDIRVLNVAGNRQSSHNPVISAVTYNTILAAFTPHAASL